MRPKQETIRIGPLPAVDEPQNAKAPDPFEDFEPLIGPVSPEIDRDALYRKIGEGANGLELRWILEGFLRDPVFAKRFAGCMEMLRAKNADYSQGEQRGDRTAAFKRIARDTEVTPEKVWYVFFSKHIGAIVSYIKRGQVESEPIDGRIDDAINYLVLLGDLISQDDGGKESK